MEEKIKNYFHKSLIGAVHPLADNGSRLGGRFNAAKPLLCSRCGILVEISIEARCF